MSQTHRVPSHAVAALGLATLLVLTVPLHANEASLAQALTRVAMNFTRSALDGAEAMPAPQYDFRPAPDARSFGEIVAHLTDANRAFCSAVAGEAQPIAASAEKENRNSPKPKQQLIAELSVSLEPCHSALPSLDDASLSRLVSFGGGELIDGRAVPARETPLGSVIATFAAHTSLHYGNMATYLRLKGHVPPTSRDASQGARSRD